MSRSTPRGSPGRRRSSVADEPRGVRLIVTSGLVPPGDTRAFVPVAPSESGVRQTLDLCTSLPRAQAKKMMSVAPPGWLNLKGSQDVGPLKGPWPISVAEQVGHFGEDRMIDPLECPVQE